jgi:hypothetical protein
MAAKLNRWQWLWVVTCVALLIGMASFSVSQNFPTVKRLEESYAFTFWVHETYTSCMEKEATRVSEGDMAKTFPCGNRDPVAEQKWFSAATSSFAYDRSHILNIQFRAAGGIVAGWLFTCAFLYLIFLFFTWVIRGIRRIGKSTS